MQPQRRLPHDEQQAALRAALLEFDNVGLSILERALSARGLRFARNASLCKRAENHQGSKCMQRERTASERLLTYVRSARADNGQDQGLAVQQAAQEHRFVGISRVLASSSTASAAAGEGHGRQPVTLGCPAQPELAKEPALDRPSLARRGLAPTAPASPPQRTSPMRTPSTPRLSKLDPQRVALDATRLALTQHATEASTLFGPSYRLLAPGVELEDAPLRKTHAFRLLRRLGDYARDGGETDPKLAEHLTLLLPLLRRLLDLTAATFEELLEQIERVADKTELGVIVGASLARSALDAGKPLSTLQLSLLAGRSQNHIADLVREGTLKATVLERAPNAGRRRERYVISAAEARRHLRAEEARRDP